MTKGMRAIAWLVLGVAVFGLVTGGLRWIRGEGDLAFVDHAHLPGFRRLEADGAAALDALAGIGRTERAPLQMAALCAGLAEPGVMPVLGPDNAPVTVISFSDYRCPHCRVLSPVLIDLASSGAARIVMQEWPVFGQPSVLAARAVLAADRQGAYLAMHTRLMRTAFVFTEPFLMAVAEELGLDVEQLRADMADPAIAAGISQAEALARSLSVRGTPALVVGRTVVEGAVAPEILRRLIAVEAEDAVDPCGAM